MAIISCPDCGKRVSNRAQKCPACGADPSSRPQHKRKRNFTAHYLMAVTMAAAGMVIYGLILDERDPGPLLSRAAPFLVIGGVAWYAAARIMSWLR